MKNDPPWNKGDKGQKLMTLRNREGSGGERPLCSHPASRGRPSRRNRREVEVAASRPPRRPAQLVRVKASPDQ